eukprot:447669-Rhodomonas_salina.1
MCAGTPESAVNAPVSCYGTRCDRCAAGIPSRDQTRARLSLLRQAAATVRTATTRPKFSRTALRVAQTFEPRTISVGYVEAYHFVLCAHWALAVQIQVQTFAQRATPCARSSGSRGLMKSTKPAYQRVQLRGAQRALHCHCELSSPWAATACSRAREHVTPRAQAALQLESSKSSSRPRLDRLLQA